MNASTGGSEVIATRLMSAVTLAVALLAAPVAVEAGMGKVYRIGVLVPGSPGGSTVGFVAPARQILRDLGYVEGQNLVLDFRFADTQGSLAQHATELVNLKVDVLVGVATLGTLAAKRATNTIPIVMAGTADPEQNGLVASLARPGANVTGIATLSRELSAKQLELLREAAPRIARVAVLWDAATPASPRFWRDLHVAAHSMGLRLESTEVRTPEDFDAAFAALTTSNPDALLTLSDPLIFSQLARIAEYSLRHRLPTIYLFREFPAVGGLMSYGPSWVGLMRQAATYIDRILKGTKPADLPVEQPTKFELAINLKTARALGLMIPTSLLLRADHVVE
jgi:putative ABC transport system substrate-binding protein